MRRWPVYPATLREAFVKEFTKEKLENPAKRSIENSWQKVIKQLRDMLVVCPNCKEESFVQDEHDTKCMNCNKQMNIAGGLKFADSTIWLTAGTIVYLGFNNEPTARVVTVPGDKYPIQIQNITTGQWMVETPSGKLKPIDPQGLMPVKAGLKVSFNSTTKAEII